MGQPRRFHHRDTEVTETQSRRGLHSQGETSDFKLMTVVTIP